MVDQTKALLHAAEVTAAWLGNANTRASAAEVPVFLRAVAEAFSVLGQPAPAPVEQRAEQEFTPAVSVRKSLARRDHIISMIDGKPYRALRRHLSANGLTPDQYRERYRLKPDYPMVAASYSEERSEHARQRGLGRKRTG